MTAFDLIYDVAENQCTKNIVPGTNGPHRHQETPVRNTSHWIITFLKIYSFTNQEKFLSKALQLSDVFFSASYRPYDKTYWLRDHSNKDKCNGLIGQAWVLESLYELYQTTGETKYLTAALSLIDSISFDVRAGLWYTTEINGDKIELDPTFNHQLWYATAVVQFVKYEPQYISFIHSFLDRTAINLSFLNQDCIIYHPIDRNLVKPTNFRVELWKRRVKKFIYPFKYSSTNNRFMEISVGYHLFNMYAFALLRSAFGSHSLWNDRSFQKAVDTTKSHFFVEALTDNRFAYPYNPPGFEAPVIYYFFNDMLNNDLIKKSSNVLKKQVEINYNFRSKRFDRNTADPETLTARIYELCRLPYSNLRNIELG